MQRCYFPVKVLTCHLLCEEHVSTNISEVSKKIIFQNLWTYGRMQGITQGFLYMHPLAQQWRGVRYSSTLLNPPNFSMRIKDRYITPKSLFWTYSSFILVMNIIFRGIRILKIALDSKIKTQYQYLYSRIVQIEVDRAGCHREKFIQKKQWLILCEWSYFQKQ